MSADLGAVQPVSAGEIGDANPVIHADLNEQDSLGETGLSSVSGEDVAASTGTPSQDALKLFDLMPALFVENQGQWSDPAIRYVHDGDGIDVAITDAGVRFGAADAQGRILPFLAAFVGANVVRPTGLEPSGTEFNYYVGDQAHWRQGVASFGVVAYQGLYEGIDLHVQGLRSHVKYEFHVTPGADYRQIAVRYDGIEGLSVVPDGSLEVNLGEGRGVIRDDAPYIYQEINGRKVEVAGRFVLLDEHTCSFEVTGVMDPNHPLVIDPNLVWSGYLGGSDDDSAGCVATDSDGNAYVAGYTRSSGWISGDYSGESDAFVAKFSPEGTPLWSSYMGGSGDDDCTEITVDGSGNVYVTGGTRSSGWISGGFDATLDGGKDAYVIKLNADGARLWGTYWGGAAWDSGSGIAVDASGVYVTGYAEHSPSWVSGGFDPDPNGGDDAFVVKLSLDGIHLWSTYLGGSGTDWGTAITVDCVGDVYVTGSTTSAGWVSGGFFTSYKGGVGDAFVVKLNSEGGHLWSTYLGGSGADAGHDIVAYELDCVYVTGSTRSAGWANGGADETLNGGSDAFLAVLGPDGGGFANTYLGGSGDDWGEAVALAGDGDAYVMGCTGSSGWTRGEFNSSLSNHHGGVDVFVAKLSKAYSHLWSVYLGGSLDDWGHDIAVKGDDIYVAGGTYSADCASGGSDVSHNGGSDALILRLSAAPDTTDPVPDPSTWETEPYATGLTSIRMVATVASDASGVQYYFDCITPGGHDSGWQDSNVYEDTGLRPSRTYAYHLRTRDMSLSHNLTLYSDVCSATTLPESTPPTVNSFGVSAVSIELGNMLTLSYTFSDSGGSGVGLIQLFRTSDPDSWSEPRISHNHGSGADGPVSGQFLDTAPSAGDWWYRVGVSDMSGNMVETEAIRVTVVDTTAPSPNPPLWATEPHGGLDWVSMSALTASDLSGVEYYFRCLTPGGHDSGWQDSNAYTDTGLDPHTAYTYEIKVRDKSGAQNETSYSAPRSGATLGDVTPPVFSDISVCSGSVDEGHGVTFTYRVSDAGGTGLDRVDLYRSGDPQVWVGQCVAQSLLSGNGPVAGTISDVPPYAAGWWYTLFVYDHSENCAYVTSIYVLVNPSGTTPPVSNPGAWATEPYATGPTSVRMIATVVGNPGDVEYYFDEISGNPGGTDSGWQDATTYEDTELSPGCSYTYQVMVRQKESPQYAEMYTAAASATTPRPVYRFWSPLTSHHFYTVSEAEKDWILATYPASVWTYEGVAFNAYADDALEGLMPVYRFWSPLTSGHFYTTSEAEKDFILATYLPSTWTYEGIAYYTFSGGQQPAGCRPTYRFWSPLTGGHFYTTSEAEKDSILATYLPSIWTYEGVVWYVLEA